MSTGAVVKKAKKTSLSPADLIKAKKIAEYKEVQSKVKELCELINTKRLGDTLLDKHVLNALVNQSYAISLTIDDMICDDGFDEELEGK